MSISTNQNDRFSLGEHAVDRSIERRRHGRGVTPEGEGGGFSQTWWPICRSEEVGPEQVLGVDFLDGRVAVFRGASGEISVVSAYCPHNGADLSVGQVQGEDLVCAFHKWQFGQSGRCTRTGSGDPVPPRAALFRYPTRERFGLIWAFNGEEPLFDLPDFGVPDDELEFLSEIPFVDINADPWVFMCNTLDFNHIRCVHGIEFDGEDPVASITWSDHSVHYPMRAHFAETGIPAIYDLSITGTNIFLQTGTANGKWFGFMFPCGMHRPGTMRSYYIIAARKGDGTPASEQEVQETLKFARDLEIEVVEQDLAILNSIRFARGMLTRSDRALGKFIDYVGKFPRAHPGADFIR